MALLQIPGISAAGGVVYAGRESLNVVDTIPITNDLSTLPVYQNHQPDFIDIAGSIDLR